MADLIYFHIDDGHFKIWGYDSYVNNNDNSCTVVTYWGRIGVPMNRLQKKEKFFCSHGAAYDFVWEKVNEKISKGYFSMPNWQYFERIEEGKPVGPLINLMEVYKREQSK